MFKIVKTTTVGPNSVRYVRPALVYEPLEKVLTYPYVWACNAVEYSTAEERLKVLRRFATYLMQRPTRAFDEGGILEFWQYVTAGDIQAWQQARNDERLATGKGARWDTIQREAELVVQFLKYVADSGVTLNFEPTTKIVLTNAQANDSMLKGMVDRRKEREVVDYKDIRIPRPEVGDEYDVDDYPDSSIELDPAINFDYLPMEQLRVVLELFPDKVYEAITLTGLHTGMRNFEILGIPVMTADRGFVSSPEMLRKKLREGCKEMYLRVEGKGSKTRTVPFDIASWLLIMEVWWPEYQHRRRRFREVTGTDLPGRELWITKDLEQLYCDPRMKSMHKERKSKLTKAFYYISGHKGNPRRTELVYGFSANYYKIRHTFATRFFYDAMSKTGNWNGDHWIRDMSIRNELRERMGHKSLLTTLEHYIETAIQWHERETPGSGRWHPNIAEYLDKRALKR